MLSHLEITNSALIIFQDVDASEVKMADALSRREFDRFDRIAAEEGFSKSPSPLHLHLPDPQFWHLTPSMCWK
jgi:hypothetical protein